MADPYLGIFDSGSSPVEDMTSLQGSPYGSYGNQTPQSAERLQHGGSFPPFSTQNQATTDAGQQAAQLQHFVDPSAMSDAAQSGFIQSSQKLQHFNDPLLSSSPGQPYTAMQGDQQQFTQLANRSIQQFSPRPSQMNVVWRGPQQPPSSTYPFMDQTRPPSSMQQASFRGLFDYGYPRANSPRLQHFADQQTGLNNVNMPPVSQAPRLGQQQVPSPSSALRFSTPSPERTNPKQSQQQQQESPQSQLRHYTNMQSNMIDLNQQQEIPGQPGVMSNLPSSAPSGKEGGQVKAGQNYSPFYGMKGNNMPMQGNSPGNGNIDHSMYNSYNNPAMQGMDRFMGMDENSEGFNPANQGPGYQYPGYGMSSPQGLAQLKTSSILLQMQRHQQQIQQLRDMPQQGQVPARIQQLQQQFQQLCHVYMLQQQRLQQNYQMQSQNQMQFMRQQQQEKANRIAVEAMVKSAFQNEASSMMPQFPSFPSAPQRTLPPNGSNPMGADRNMSHKPSEPIQLGPSIVNKPVSRMSRPPATVLSKPSPMKNKKEDSDCEPSPPSSPIFGFEDDQSSSITRRSLRERRKKTYKDDFDYNLSDDDGEKEKNVQGHPAPVPDVVREAAPAPVIEEFEETMIVEKILAKRLKDVKGDDGQTTSQVEEFLVKYKNYSYLHSEWAIAEKLARADKRIQMKIKRYKIKQQNLSPFFAEMEEEPFNPDYTEIDRVLDVSTGIDQHSGEPITHYLVKWRSLPYEDSTWEAEADVEEAKIPMFYKLRDLPPMHLRQFRPRPHPHEWLRLEASPVFKENNTLREYQLEGVNWLTFCWCNRQNSILADEMGLGKTIQSIAFTCEMQRFGVRGPFLVIAPLSTISNWQREYETWSDMNVVVYHGSASSRHLIQEYEFYFRDELGHPLPGLFKFQVLVTTYEIIIADNVQLCTVPWRAVIIDEAHRLKNRNCKLLEGLNNLKMEHRILLTGTPLQNNVDELFSLLNFLEPSQFPSQEVFLMEFGNLKTESQVDKLKALLKPMMLRRLKEDVEKNIAPKEETIVEVELTTVQKKFYRAIIERNFAFLSKGATSSANVPNLMNTMMELRKCCNHPFLINGAEEKILAEYLQGSTNNRIDKHMFAMIEASGKLVLIHKLLPKLKLGGHKVLVFSQMVRCLDILEDYLVHMKYPYERIDGRVRGNLRQAAIDRFSKPESDRFVFLLCTRAGGLGINLTAADTVIIFDSDWNPQNDLQAQARCHRIGQSKSVKVYRLITRNSYEREMFDRASLKLGLDKAVLQSMNTKENAGSNGSSMSKKEIEDLLKRGAYGAIMEEDSDDAAKFCEEDIDQILERRTQIIQLESEGKGSTFAKASFVSARGEEDIDVDDPDFWKKWAKKADLDMDYMSNKDDRILDAPRQRKQTRRYGNEDGDFELSDLEEEEEVVVPRRAAWTRVECFRVEKNLLVYGWGRFKEILLHGRFKSKLAERDVECIARSILIYCLHHYHGDDKVKAFIRDIIKTSVAKDKVSIDDRDKTYSPISTPSKSKKGKRGKNSSKNSNKSAIALLEVGLDWKSIDPESIVLDNGYKKHLQHHCNKILLRVRLLFYLKTEVIGSLAPIVREGITKASDLDITIYNPEGEPPNDWWDVDADKSLLVGVFKHGYERYNLIRADPMLCFVSRVGLPNKTSDPPDNDAIDQDDRDEDEVNDDPDYHQPSNSKEEDELDYEEDKETVSAISSPSTPRKAEKPPSEGVDTGVDTGSTSTSTSMGLRWPSASDLNTRLRRLVNGYQRVHRRQELKKAAAEKEKERKEKFEEAIRQKEQKKLEMAQKWSKREEVDFYRTVSTFGVEYDKLTDTYDWTQFRRLARLDKKTDNRLTSYYKDFVAMCRRVCGRPLEEDKDRGVNVETISEERASRCLFRIQLLTKIREKVLLHEELDERLKLAQPSSDFPDWWIPGLHDKDLMNGVVKHGLVRTDYHVLNDPDLCFAEILTKLATQQKTIDKIQNPGNNFDQSATSGHSIPLSDPPIPSNKDDMEESDIKMPAIKVPSPFDQNLDRTMDPSLGLPDREITPELCENKSFVEDERNREGDVDRASKPVEPEDMAAQDPVVPVASSVNNIEEDSQINESIDGPVPGFGESTMVSVKWPKDRIVMQRLDQLCDCVLKGVWPVRPKAEPIIPNQLGIPSPSTGLSNMMDMESGMMIPGMMLDGNNKDEKAFQVQRMDGLKLSLKKHRRKRKKDGLLVKEGDTDSIGSDGDLTAHRKPRKLKKEANFWPDHALSMDLPIPHQQPHMGEPLLGEKTPKKRRRKKEDKGEKPDKQSTVKKRVRKPKTAKLGSAGSHQVDSGGMPLRDYLDHDWTGGSQPSAAPQTNIKQKLPGIGDLQMSSGGQMVNDHACPSMGVTSDQTARPKHHKLHDNMEGLQGNSPGVMYSRPPNEPLRSNPTTPTAGTPPSLQYFSGDYNDTNYRAGSSQPEEHNSSGSSSPSSPSPSDSFTSQGYSYDQVHRSGYQHPYGHYGGVPYASPYNMGVPPSSQVSAKSPGVSSPSAMSSHFMFGNTYNSMYGGQASYRGYPYMGMNNGGTASSVGLNRESSPRDDDNSSPEATTKPFITSNEGNPNPQTKSPTTVIT